MWPYFPDLWCPGKDIHEVPLVPRTMIKYECSCMLSDIIPISESCVVLCTGSYIRASFYVLCPLHIYFAKNKNSSQKLGFLDNSNLLLAKIIYGKKLATNTAGSGGDSWEDQQLNRP